MNNDTVSVAIATELRAEVEKMITDDPKMFGIARYLASVEIFWSYAIETACAGHGFIFFNPDFWAQMPVPTRTTTIAHEVWHLILKHLDRGIGFNLEDYNTAADHVINNVLEREGFIFDFTGMDFEPCKDPKYIGMSTEEVYNDIHAERKKQEQDPQADPSNKPKKLNHVPRSVIEDLVKAAADAKAGNDNYNNVPKHIDKDKKELDDLKVSIGNETGYSHIELEITDRNIAIKGSTYEEIFADYLIDPISGAKRSFMRPNRRMHGTTGFKLPGRVIRNKKSNRLAHLMYALDVSGSINSWTRQTFHDSVRTIKELLNPNLLTVLFFDTEIKLVKTFTDKQPYGKIKVEAGGCTCLNAVYAYAALRKPEAMVIFTDLAVKIPSKPNWHTIWLLPEKYREASVNDLYGDIYIIPQQ